MKENIAELWYNRVKDSEDPANDLMKFYCELAKKSVNVKDKEFLGGLVVLYGRKRVFQSILDFFGYYGKSRLGTTMEHSTLRKIVENSFKDSINNSPVLPNLEDYIVETQRKIEESKNAV